MAELPAISPLDSLHQILMDIVTLLDYDVQGNYDVQDNAVLPGAWQRYAFEFSRQKIYSFWFVFRSSHEVGQLDRIDAIGKDLEKSLQDCLEETEYKSTLDHLTEIFQIINSNINSTAITDKVRAILKANPNIYNINEKVKNKIENAFQT